MKTLYLTLSALTTCLFMSTEATAQKHQAEPSNTAVVAPQRMGVIGVWQTAKQEDENRTASVEIFPCADNNATLCGKIVALEEPIDPETNAPKLDKHNPDEALRTRPVMGLLMLKGFEKKDDTYYDGGTIYSARTGKTYASSLKIHDNDTLDVTGYVFFFSKTQQWKRVK